MRLDISTSTIYLTYRDFMEHSGSTGSVTIPQRQVMGMEFHRSYQTAAIEKDENAEAEVPIKYTFELGDFTCVFNGRIDMLYKNENVHRIEELKTAFYNSGEYSDASPEAIKSYTFQLLVYTYFYQLVNPEIETESYLIVHNLANGETKEKRIEIDKKQIEQDINKMLTSILLSAISKKDRQEQKTAAAESLVFPYENMRAGQQGIINLADSSLGRQTLMLSAATGIGKTISILYPAIKYIFRKNKMLYWAIPKKTQREIVFKSLKDIQDANNIKIRTIFISAKQGMCLNDEYICEEEHCPYIREYYKRLKESDAVNELLEVGLIDREHIIEKAREKLLCPFELALDTSMECDVLIGDYNYIFDPFIRIQRYFVNNCKDFVLCVDEGHNLPGRMRNVFNMELKSGELKALIKKKVPKEPDSLKEFRDFLSELEKWLQSEIKEFKKEYQGVTEGFWNIDGDKLFGFKMRSSELMINYMMDKKLNKLHIDDGDIVNFYFLLNRFINYAMMENLKYRFCINTEEKLIKILTLDFADVNREFLKNFNSVVIFSATIEPAEFYENILGLPEPVKPAIFDSPFPPENKLVNILNDVSTRYNKRDEYYEHIAKHISDIVTLHEKNYIVFFSSFSMLENVTKHIKTPNFGSVIQKAAMKEQERELVLKLFKVSKKPMILYGVTGGIFAEGMDNFGSNLGGIIIVSPAVPIFNFEQEAIRNYFDNKFDTGFEYAYLYPAINKVIQAGGRLIRRETDRGILVLVGERFAEKRYYKYLPESWYGKNIKSIIRNDYITPITDFWNAGKE